MSDTKDGDELKRIVTEKRRSGRLPQNAPPRAWTGRGTGENCVLCEYPIETGHIEYEVEWQDGASVQLLRFHELCYRLWSED